MAYGTRKLFNYLLAGFNILRCQRKGEIRIIQFQAAILSFYRPALRLSRDEYVQAMDELIEFLVRARENGDEVDVKMDHFGHEWVVWKRRSNVSACSMALSRRTLDRLKQHLSGTDIQIMPKRLPNRDQHQNQVG